MCDTFVALPGATSDGSVVFGKNSDREPNEAHEVVLVPAAAHAAGSEVRCTYRSIPQAPRTHAVLLAKPYWIWGAEMGANEHGLVIGNEAVFTKEPYEDTPGLIGMDLLRLALERADSARDGVDVITALLGEHGQGGNAGHTHKLRYHNSFLLADPEDAWVLETAGREWAAQRVTSFRSISNAITIGATYDLASDGLVARAVRKGWCKSPEDFHFARTYSDFLYTRFSAASPRQCRTTALLAAQRGAMTPALAMGVLRDHGRDDDTGWSPARGVLGQDVCAHAGFGPVRVSQSTGSLVTHLAMGAHTHWLTATSAPCTSVFKPVWFDAGLPDLGPAPTGRYDPATLWWRHEDLHREVLRDYVSRRPAFAREQAALEAELLAAAATAATGSAQDRAACSAEAFARAATAEKGWLDDVLARPIVHRRPVLHERAWRSFDAAAGRRSLVPA
jgi:dipeptidase